MRSFRAGPRFHSTTGIAHARQPVPRHQRPRRRPQLRRSAVFARPGADLSRRLLVAGGAGRGAGRQRRHPAAHRTAGAGREASRGDGVATSADPVLAGTPRLGTSGRLLAGGGALPVATLRALRTHGADRVVPALSLPTTGGAVVSQFPVGLSAAGGGLPGHLHPRRDQSHHPVSVSLAAVPAAFSLWLLEIGQRRPQLGQSYRPETLFRDPAPAPHGQLVRPPAARMGIAGGARASPCSRS